eukprot:IDg5500t1
MMHPSFFDWQVQVSEYCIQVAAAWLYALYNEFRMYRLSPRVGKKLEALPDEAAKAVGGLRNLADLRSLARFLQPPNLGVIAPQVPHEESHSLPGSDRPTPSGAGHGVLALGAGVLLL